MINNELVNKYNKFLCKYLKEKLPLEEIDKSLKESDLDFKKIDKKDMDLYQKNSKMELNYIYLRNNIYIDKLSEEDISFLENNDYNEEFIKRTYKDVINEYEDVKTVFYGPKNEIFKCNTNEIVLGIRYDEFNTNLDGDKFKENFLKKEQVISQLIYLIKAIGLKELKENINVILYNNISVKEDSYEK